MARFEWSMSQSGERSVAVYPVDEANGTNTVPFFSATLTPMNWCPNFPISTRYLPLDTTLVQPPLPTGEAVYLAGTDTWKLCRLVASAKRAKLIWAEVHSPDVEAQHWPQVQPWSLGVFLQKGELTIKKPDEFSV